MIKGLSHIALSVANLDRSIDFYCTALGMKVVVETVFDDEKYATILALPGARGRVALLKADTFELELFEFIHPVPRSSDRERPVCEHGITHFCVEVTNIDVEYERLARAGVAFHCPPLNFVGIGRATYGRDPDGNVIEFVEFVEMSRERPAPCPPCPK